MQDTIVIKSEDSIMLTAPVMIPGAKDCDFLRGEKPFTVEQVKAFKEAYDDYGFVDKHHAIQSIYSANKNELVGNALKSFLLTENTSYKWFDGTTHTYPAGTWMLTTEITNPVAIKQVKDGLITGYSPSIFRREQAEQIKAALKASQGGLIKDIIDPVPALVSLVRKPCQHGNKFCKNNSGENMSEDTKAQSKLNQIMNILGGKEPEYAMKEDLNALKEEITSAFKSDEFKTSLISIVNECVVEALQKPGLKEDGNNDDDDTKKDDKNEGSSGEDDDKNSDDKGGSNPDDDDAKKDDKKAGLKQDSKRLPLHDGNKPALKSDTAIVMEMMGRDLSGRPKTK